MIKFLKLSAVEQGRRVLRATQFLPTIQNQYRLRQRQPVFKYESMEKRQVLSAYFPAYVGGSLTLGDPDSSAPYALADTFKLETNPGASKTIYLDYDGHHSRNNVWRHNIQFPAFDRDGKSGSFSNAELIEIQKQFQNVAEDFAPFDVNVTTKDPGVARLTKTNSRDSIFGIRVVNTQATRGFGDDFGGIAYLNSFNDSIDNPVFVINKGVNIGGMTNSHEVGHALGMSHDGLYDNPYHPGVGAGETSWGPILGGPFRANLSQWSNGNYAGSTTSENDIAIITRNSNGIDVKVDDHGNTRSSASALGKNSQGVFDWGFIERHSDVDVFRFTTATGNINLSVNAFSENPNLDVLAKLRDSSGQLVATRNPVDGVNASFNMRLNAGIYYISVDGVGKPGVYSDYGSLGFYTIEGTVATSVPATPIGESGRVSNLYDAWRTVTLSRNYVDPVVVAGPASTNGGDPVTVRIRNVKSNSFQIRLDEWEYRDGRHGFEKVDYMVVESGTHRLSDGTKIVARNATGQTDHWKSYNFGGAFVDSASAPIVLAQTSSINENVAVANRLQNVTKTGFKMKLQEEQKADQSHRAERVDWIAIETGVGNASGLGFVAGLASPVDDSVVSINYGRDFVAQPGFFAAIQTFAGSDTATVRHRKLTNKWANVFIEEEQSLDKERTHGSETIGFFAIPSGTIKGTSVVGSAEAFVANGIATNVFDEGADNGIASSSQSSANDPLLDSSLNGPYSSSEDEINAAFIRASMDHRGLLIDGDLSAAQLEFDSWDEYFLPLGETGDHDHGHDHDLDRDHDHDHSHDHFEAEFDPVINVVEEFVANREAELHDWLEQVDVDHLVSRGWNFGYQIEDGSIRRTSECFDPAFEEVNQILDDVFADLESAFVELKQDVNQLFDRWF